jgi:hypothetical protein
MSVADRSYAKRAFQHRMEGGPTQFGGLAGNEDSIVADVLHQPFDQFYGRRAHARKTNSQFLELARGGETGNRLVVELTGALFVDPPDRAAEVARPGRLAQDTLSDTEERIFWIAA